MPPVLLLSTERAGFCRVAASGTLGRVQAGTQRVAGTLASSGAALQRPVAPDLVADATSAAVSAAAAAVDLSCMELDVVAVGMGLRFVELETNQVGGSACHEMQQQTRSL